jgi:hypothetical protein
MRRLIWVCLLVVALPVYAADEVRKGGANDLSFATPNQGAETTWQSPGGRTVTYIDAAHIPFRNANDDVDSLVDGSDTLTLTVAHVSGPTKAFGAAFKTPTASDAPFLFKAIRAMTVTQISCVTTAGTVSIRFQECDSAASNCTNIDGAVLVCSTTPATDASITVNDSIDADDWVKIVYSAPSSVDWATATVLYTD